MKPLHGHRYCLLLSFLFTDVYFLSGTNDNLLVLQLPSSLNLTKGETARIKCSWIQKKTILERIRVTWSKNETKIEEDLKRVIIESNKTGSVLVIHNVSSNDSGFYNCKVIVEIPKLDTFIGHGTQLTVNSETNGTTVSEAGATSDFPLTLTVSLAVVVGLLVTCVPLIIWRFRNTGQKMENTVINETPFDSEEPRNMDEHGESSSNSSRGSTQWCQVPVYETYFDHRRDEDDG